jgi:Flp pilus assembly protein TadG
MSTEPTPPRPTTHASRPVSRRRRRRDEHGIVLVWMALTLVVLLMFAGFMVDLGAWYQQSQDLQRAADAAALAGSTYLPGSPGNGNPALCPAPGGAAPTDAYCAALKTLIKNGYPNATLTATPDPNNNRQLDVTVTQSGISQYFTSFFMGPLTFTRNAHAQFSQPIDLGSPQNYFGTGTLMGFTGFVPNSTPNFWATIAGYCAAKESGDEYASGFDGNVGNVHNGSYTLGASFPTDCDPTQDSRIGNPSPVCNLGQNENCEFDPLGYEYTIVVPPGLSNAHVYLFNAGFNPCLDQPAYSGGSLVTAANPPYGAPLMDVDPNLATHYPCGGGGGGGFGNNYTSFNTYYTLVSPMTESAQTWTAGTSYNISSTGYPRWTDLTAQQDNNGNNISPLQPGTYYLDVSTLNVNWTNLALAASPSGQDAGPSYGIHNYGILVSTNSSRPSSNLTNGGTYVCTTAPCPTVFANTSTAEGLTIVSPGGTSAATAYLANVPAEAVGKLVTLKIWDPGDFAQYLQIMKPDGTTLGAAPGDPGISYSVYGADPSAQTLYGTLPTPNNTAATSGVVSGCVDPLTGSTFAGSSGPCFPVDGCTPLDASNTENQLPLTDCFSEYPTYLGNSTPPNDWGAPHNRFGPSRYSDAMVELSFVAPAAGWYGIKEVTSLANVHDTITLNLLINGLPPHLTP